MRVNLLGRDIRGHGGDGPAPALALVDVDGFHGPDRGVVPGLVGGHGGGVEGRRRGGRACRVLGGTEPGIGDCVEEVGLLDLRRGSRVVEVGGGGDGDGAIERVRYLIGCKRDGCFVSATRESERECGVGKLLAPSSSPPPPPPSPPPQTTTTTTMPRW